MVKIGNIELGDTPLLLAPMEDVTDPPFRYVCKMFGADLMYTEFISSEGLIRDAAKSVKKLDFDEIERPVGIQIFGHNIDSMVEAAHYAEEAQPDLIDINFGCSVKKVVSKGAGAGILNDIPKMVKMTEAIVKAVKLPVTVKTRLGYDDQHREIVDIAEQLQDTGIKALSIHGRLRTTKYSQPADWTLIGEVTNNPRMHIPIFGNGDITSAETARHLIDTYGVDGLMIGRAVYGNPWIFKEVKHYLTTGQLLKKPDIHERVKIVKIQLQRSVDWKGERTGILEMRKHWGNYFKGYPNFKPFKLRLMSTESHQEVLSIVDEIEQYFSEEGK
ncbi:MAG: tRNA dihydrouridine synthase DusB [Bacteroidetes bacterium]|nr:MAG: tRNA dihydrouridine synthase DusB [Bacteroidota bacterium]